MAHIEEILPVEVAKKIENDENITIIDVREDEEVKEGMVPTAKHIPLGQIPNETDKLPKEQEYVMICRSGRRSMNAAEHMNEKGFSNVKNMQGGMLDWDGELVF